MAERAVRARRPSHRGDAGGKQERPAEPEDCSLGGGPGLCRSDIPPKNVCFKNKVFKNVKVNIKSLFLRLHVVGHRRNKMFFVCCFYFMNIYSDLVSCVLCAWDKLVPIFLSSCSRIERSPVHGDLSAGFNQR